MKIFLKKYINVIIISLAIYLVILLIKFLLLTVGYIYILPYIGYYCFLVLLLFYKFFVFLKFIGYMYYKLYLLKLCYYVYMGMYILKGYYILMKILVIQYYYFLVNVCFVRDYLWFCIFRGWDLYYLITNIFKTNYYTLHCYIFYISIRCFIEFYLFHELIVYIYIISPWLHWKVYVFYAFIYKVIYFVIYDLWIFKWYFYIKFSLYNSWVLLYNYTIYLFMYYLVDNFMYPYRIWLYICKNYDMTFFFYVCSIFHESFWFFIKFIYISKNILGYTFMFFVLSLKLCIDISIKIILWFFFYINILFYHLYMFLIDGFYSNIYYIMFMLICFLLFFLFFFKINFLNNFFKVYILIQEYIQEKVFYEKTNDTIWDIDLIVKFPFFFDDLLLLYNYFFFSLKSFINVEFIFDFRFLIVNYTIERYLYDNDDDDIHKIEQNVYIEDFFYRYKKDLFITNMYNMYGDFLSSIYVYIYIYYELFFSCFKEVKISNIVLLKNIYFDIFEEFRYLEYTDILKFYYNNLFIIKNILEFNRKIIHSSLNLKNLKNTKNVVDTFFVKVLYKTRKLEIYSKLRTNPIIRYSLSNFYFDKWWFNLLYNSKFVNYYVLYLYNKIYNFNLFNFEVNKLIIALNSYKLDIEIFKILDTYYNDEYEYQDDDDESRIENDFEIFRKPFSGFLRNEQICNIYYNDVLDIHYLSFYELSNLKYSLLLTISDYDTLFSTIVDDSFFLSAVMKDDIIFYFDIFGATSDDIEKDFDILQNFFLYENSLLDEIYQIERECGDGEEDEIIMSRFIFTNAEYVFNFDHIYFLKTFNFDILDYYFFFDEYSSNYINTYLFIFLYDVLFYQKINRINYFLINVISDNVTSYFYELFHFDVCNLWDYYFIYLFENIRYNSKVLNNYIFSDKYALLNEYSLDKFDNKYKVEDLDYFKFKAKDVKKMKNINKLYLTSYLSEDLDGHLNEYTSEFYPNGTFFIDNYRNLLDLEFYVHYNNIVEESYRYDQCNYTYLQFEKLKVVNIELLDEHFFRFIDLFLLPKNIRDSLYVEENFHFEFDVVEEDLIPAEFYPYDDDEESFYSSKNSFTLRDRFINDFPEENIVEDINLYVISNYTPFETLQIYFKNVLDYKGFDLTKTYSNVEYFLYNFFFDYYYYAMKMFLLEYILFYEYNTFLPNMYVLGPISEHIMSFNDLSGFQKVVFFFNRLCNFFLDFQNFERFYFCLGSYKCYYGFMIQFPFFIFFYVLKYCLYPIIARLATLSSREELEYPKVRRFAIIRYASVYYFFEKFFEEVFPNFRTYALLDTSEYEGFIDQEYVITSEILKSMGVDGFLADLDNRYFLKNPYISVTFSYDTVGFYAVYLYLYFIRDCILLCLIYAFDYFHYLVKRFLGFVVFIFECICFSFGFILFLFFMFFFISCLSISYFFINIYSYINYLNTCILEILECCYFFEFLLLINVILIFPFELIRVCCTYVYNNFIIKIIIKYDYVFIRLLLLLKKSMVLLFYLLKFIVFFLIKICLLYVLFILIFDNYDNIIIFLEKFNIKFSYRTIFVFYGLNLFCICIFLLSPFNVRLWSFRYVFLVLLLILWFLAGLMNSTDILFSSLWGKISNSMNDVFYGPFLYKKFIYPISYEDIWVHKTRSRVINEWDHFNFVGFINGCLYVLDLIHLDLQPLVYQLNSLVSPYKSIFELNMKKVVDNINKFNMIFSFDGDKINTQYFSNVFSFFGIYYNIFVLNFLTFHFDFFFSEFVGRTSLYGYGHGPVTLSLLLEKKSKSQMNLLRINYYVQMFKLLRRDLWGNFSVQPQHFFIFYRRRWFVSEKHFVWLGLSSMAHERELVGFFNPYTYNFYHMVADLVLSYRFAFTPLLRKEYLGAYVNDLLQQSDFLELVNCLKDAEYSYIAGEIKEDFGSNAQVRMRQFARSKGLTEKEYFFAHILYRSYMKYQGSSTAFLLNIANLFYFDRDFFDFLYYRDNPEKFINDMPLQDMNWAFLGRKLYKFNKHHSNNLYYVKYLLPDFGFIGSVNWGVNWKYLMFDRRLINDGLYYRTGRRVYRRLW